MANISLRFGTIACKSVSSSHDTCSKNTNFYQLLSLSSSKAGNQEIKRAYRTLVLKYHPDVSHDHDTTKTFIMLHAAYKTLMDPELRAEYDCTLGCHGCRITDDDVGVEGRRWEAQIVELRKRSSYRVDRKEGSWGSRAGVHYRQPVSREVPKQTTDEDERQIGRRQSTESSDVRRFLIPPSPSFSIADDSPARFHFLIPILETSELSNPIDVLKFMKELDYFPNACIAYRILLTIPVTVASAERSFSKLKLLKSYLRFTMTQERLSGLAMISIENEMLENINYEELINQFAIKNAKRASRIIG
ncbi:hypothetical protein LXL04_001401 [Taraxacum kok-saghyz]